MTVARRISRLWAWQSRVRFSAGPRDFFSSPKSPDHLLIPLSLLFHEYRVLLPRSSGRGMSWPLTAIWCRRYESVVLNLFSHPSRNLHVALNINSYLLRGLHLAYFSNLYFYMLHIPNTVLGTLFSVFVLFRESCKTFQLIKCRSIRNSHLLCTYVWVRHQHLCGRPWQGCNIPLAMLQPNWRWCSMCCGAHRSCWYIAHNPIFSTQNIYVVPVTLYVFVLIYIRVTIAECYARRSELPEHLFSRSQGRCDATMMQGARMFAPWPPGVTQQMSWTLLYARGENSIGHV